MKNIATLKGNALTQELTKHFGYLLPSTNWKPVLLSIMEQVQFIEAIDATLVLHFKEPTYRT